MRQEYYSLHDSVLLQNTTLCRILAAMKSETPLALAIKLVGGAEQVAALRELKSGWAVRKWLKDGLPAEHVLWLSERTAWRVTPHQLSPDLYPHPEDGLPPLFRRAARRASKSAGPESTAPGTA